MNIHKKKLFHLYTHVNQKVKWQKFNHYYLFTFLDKSKNENSGQNRECLWSNSHGNGVIKNKIAKEQIKEF